MEKNSEKYLYKMLVKTHNFYDMKFVDDFSNVFANLTSAYCLDPFSTSISETVTGYSNSNNTFFSYLLLWSYCFRNKLHS